MNRRRVSDVPGDAKPGTATLPRRGSRPSEAACKCATMPKPCWGAKSRVSKMRSSKLPCSLSVRSRHVSSFVPARRRCGHDDTSDGDCAYSKDRIRRRLRRGARCGRHPIEICGPLNPRQRWPSRRAAPFEAADVGVFSHAIGAADRTNAFVALENALAQMARVAAGDAILRRKRRNRRFGDRRAPRAGTSGRDNGRWDLGEVLLGGPTAGHGAFIAHREQDRPEWPSAGFPEAARLETFIARAAEEEAAESNTSGARVGAVSIFIINRWSEQADRGGLPHKRKGHGHSVEKPLQIAKIRYRSLQSRLGWGSGFGAIYLDKHMPTGVYYKRGICVRNHRGAEPPRDIEPTGLVTTVGWRDRASTSYAAADRVKAPASAARGRFRRIHGGCTAPSLPAET